MNLSNPNSNIPKPKVGVVGLGFMGSAITQRLLDAGYPTYVWNRTRDKAESLNEQGAIWSESPLVDCSHIVISLYSSQVVEEVLAPWFDLLTPSHLLIDTTTGDPEASVGLAKRIQAKGAEYLEAPISGSSEQTRRGEATVIAAGNPTAFQACRELLPVLGKHIFYVGPSGNAAKMKLVSNLVLGLNRAAVAEGLHFAEALGIELESALQVLLGSGAYSKQMETKGPKMIRGDYAPQARLAQHLKDVHLMLDSASSVGIELPLTNAHRELLERAVSDGFGDLDNSALFASMRKGTT